MAKSKHPSLLEKATDDIARINKELKKENAALKDFVDACASASKLASSTISDFSDQYDYLAKVIEDYGRKVAEIIEAERQLDDEAKGDKKKEAKLKKQLAKAEKEADAIRKEYGLAGEIYTTLTGLIFGEMEKVNAAAGKFRGFKSKK